MAAFNPGRFPAYFAALLLPLLLASCGWFVNKERVDTVVHTRAGLEVTLSAFDATQARIDEAGQEVLARLQELEDELDPRAGGALSRIVASGTVQVSERAMTLLERAQEICLSTEGAFDVSVGAVLDLWRTAGAAGAKPDEAMLASALEKVGCRLTRLSRSKLSVSLAKAGMRLETAGILKGLMAAEAAEIVRRYGMTKGIVDILGDVLLFSGRADEAFKVGITHPLDPGRPYAVLELAEGAVMTSSCIGKNQGDACELIDPRKGRPVTGVYSVTVVALDPITADAYSTALFVLGPEEGFALAKTLPELDAVFLFPDGKGGVRMKATPGLKDKISLVEKN